MMVKPRHGDGVVDTVREQKYKRDEQGPLNHMLLTHGWSCHPTRRGLASRHSSSLSLDIAVSPVYRSLHVLLLLDKSVRIIDKTVLHPCKGRISHQKIRTIMSTRSHGSITDLPVLRTSGRPHCMKVRVEPQRGRARRVNYAKDHLRRTMQSYSPDNLLSHTPVGRG